MAEKVKIKDSVNPFARSQFQPPEKKKKEEEKKKPAKKSTNWMDLPFDSLKYVGDYFRGSQSK